MSYYNPGNILSVLAFFLWIPVALYGMYRWPPAKATASLFFAGLLFLPEVVFFKFPGIPQFAKLEIILVWIFIGALLFHRERLKTAPRSWWFRACLGLLVVGAVVTVFSNADEFRIGSKVVPGHVPYDVVHALFFVALSALLPFYLGATMFRGAADLRVLLTSMVIAAILYSPLQLLEGRMSPQLNQWVYGFYQHGFVQTLRGSGYRPMVFMAHGLALALFTSLSVLAAETLQKRKIKILRLPSAWAMSYLGVILVLSKSVAALLYAVAGAPLIWFASPRIQALAATVLVALLLAYPVARANGLIPVEAITAWAEEQYGPDRAQSLGVRFQNESNSLDRAMERPWFGWGKYCRACLFDPWSGGISSVRDGAWVIQLGDAGIVGFIGKFGLLLFPLLVLLRRIKYVTPLPERRLLAGLGLIVGFSAFDLIPNADFNPLAFVLSGALFGSLAGILREAAMMRMRRMKSRKLRIAAENEAANTAPVLLAGVAALCASLLAAPAGATAPDAVGGGFADAGVEGAYYANPDLEGAPSFTRRDVRIDFDWGRAQSIGGSTAEPYRSFPRDEFSVRWSGRIIARFSEVYTFQGEADEGIRVRVRRSGQPGWSTLVDRWNKPGAFESQPFMMGAGELYDIQVEYRESGGEARCRLMWKSKSTPTEVIDPVRQQGINLSPHVWADYIWADLMKSRRYGANRDQIDDAGWPTTSGLELIASEMLYPNDPEMSGTYLLRFRGQAEVWHRCCVNAVFQADGGRFPGKLPKGAGYDASTNTTSALMVLPGSRTMLTFEDTQRVPGTRGDGVSRISLMRPIEPGSAQHHRPDEIVYRPFARVVRDHFTVVRFLGFPKGEGGDWSERTVPDYALFIGNNGQENWEYLIMLANETGRDLYITIPIGANDEYLEKLALLMRYGSDGREPYRRPTADPAYPPLNPNLRVYVEFDNEIWNWAFESTQVAKRLTQGEHARGGATWKIIDYDEQAGDPQGIKAMRRWHAVRTVQASKTFRRVWGDGAMGSRVRVLMEYQYDNYQDTARSSLDFIDGYYNNRSATHVRDPHPVHYYIWGGGGAAYYGLANSNGEQSHTLLKDAGFEARSIEPGTFRNRPPGTAWTFKGQAGLIRPDGKTPIDGFQNLPMPTSGTQAAFLMGQGSISQQVRFAKPGTYAVRFNAAGSAMGWPTYQPFDILLDERKISPRDQKDHRVSPRTAFIGGWARNINSLAEEWGSAVFRIDRPGVHTLTFVGRDAASNYVLVDDVRIASADEIVTSDFDKGNAQGQVGDPDFAYQLRTQAKYARAFGLQVVAYESGWGLGGDFYQKPIQNWCKLEDRRAKGVNDRAIRLWDESGSFLNVWGVYTYWPSHDFAGAGNYPIMQSFRSATERLPDEPTHGRRLPTSLRPGDADWSHDEKTSGPFWRRYLPCCNDSGAQWHAWVLIAPATETYGFRIVGSGSGRLIIEVDGEPLATLNSLDETSSVPLRAKLTKGAHAVRVVVVGDELELERVEVGVENLGSPVQ